MLNKVQSKSVDVTSYEILTNKKHFLSQKKVWDSPDYAKRTVSDKLEAKSEKCLLVGYPKDTHG